MKPLVLSLFPGGGILDYAFELEGFCVVRGPDPLWGGDIRTFHPPAGRFDGIIGGDPCQSHSSLANLVRAKGLEPSFPDLTGEYQRVVEEARPAWFLRENVPKAPDVKPCGYSVRSFLLDNATLDSGDGTGNEQMRRRRFWFGTRDQEPPELRRWIDFALFELPDAVTAVGGNDGTADAIGGYRKARDKARRKVQAVTEADRAVPVAMVQDGKGGLVRKRTAPVTGRHEDAVGTPDIDYSPPRRTLEEMLRLQGLPPDFWGTNGKHCPFKMSALRKMCGNGVAVYTGRALARAIRIAMYEEPQP